MSRTVLCLSYLSACLVVVMSSYGPADNEGDYLGSRSLPPSSALPSSISAVTLIVIPFIWFLYRRMHRYEDSQKNFCKEQGRFGVSFTVNNVTKAVQLERRAFPIVLNDSSCFNVINDETLAELSISKEEATFWSSRDANRMVVCGDYHGSGISLQYDKVLSSSSSQVSVEEHKVVEFSQWYFSTNTNKLKLEDDVVNSMLLVRDGATAREFLNRYGSHIIVGRQRVGLYHVGSSSEEIHSTSNSTAYQFGLELCLKFVSVLFGGSFGRTDTRETLHKTSRTQGNGSREAFERRKFDPTLWKIVDSDIYNMVPIWKIKSEPSALLDECRSQLEKYWRKALPHSEHDKSLIATVYHQRLTDHIGASEETGGVERSRRVSLTGRYLKQIEFINEQTDGFLLCGDDNLPVNISIKNEKYLRVTWTEDKNESICGFKIRKLEPPLEELTSSYQYGSSGVGAWVSQKKHFCHVLEPDRTLSSREPVGHDLKLLLNTNAEKNKAEWNGHVGVEKTDVSKAFSLVWDKKDPASSASGRR